MSGLYVYTDEVKKRKRITTGVLLCLVSLVFIILAGITGKYKAPQPLFALFAMISLLVGLFTITARHTLFVDITNDWIHWMNFERHRPEFHILWADVHWIKNENDHTITVNHEGGPSQQILLKNFTSEDQDAIKSAITTIGSEKNIRLINF